MGPFAYVLGFWASGFFFVCCCCFVSLLDVDVYATGWVGRTEEDLGEDKYNQKTVWNFFQKLTFFKMRILYKKAHYTILR